MRARERSCWTTKMIKDHEGIGGFILAIAGGLIYLMWPVSLWLGIVCIAVYILHCSKLYFERQHETGRWRAPLAKAAKDLRDNALCIACGLAALALVQLLLVAVGSMADESTVRRWEDHLAGARDAVTSVLAFRYWWKLWVALVVVTILFRALTPVSFFTARRKLIGRILLVLNTMNAFTFFSAAAVGSW